MKKQIIILFYFMVFSNIEVFSQNEEIQINDLNGIWKNSIDTVQYVFFKNGRTLSVSYEEIDPITNSKMQDPFYFIGVSSYCFIDKIDILKNVNDSSIINSLEGIKDPDLKYCKDHGNSGKSYFYWDGPARFDYDKNKDLGDALELENERNVFFYRKVKKIPSIIYKELYKQSQKDKHDYLKEFLDMDFREITVMKSIINSSPSVPSKQYVIRGDIIEIIDRKDQWLKIRYYGSKTIEGWIKKSDVE